MMIAFDLYSLFNNLAFTSYNLVDLYQTDSFNCKRPEATVIMTEKEEKEEWCN